MSWSIVVLCLSAAVLVALAISAVVGLSLPLLDRLGNLLSPRHKVGFWVALAALPVVVGALAVLATMLPALGVGSDHCLLHGLHHPHLCPHHMVGTPGLVLTAIAALGVARVAWVALACARVVRLSQVTGNALAEGSDRQGEVLIFPSDEPQAFVLGTVHPQVYVSQGLLALGGDLVEPVLAHERAHASHHDFLWRALCPVLASAHVPWVGYAVGSRLATAQELAADSEAAEVLHDPVRIAEALLTLAKLRSVPTPGLSFTDGDLRCRVFALLNPSMARGPWPPRLLVGGSVAVATAMGVHHDAIHHGLETLLGALS